MKLYYAKGACSLTPHIVLEALGLPYEAEAVDLKTKTTASGADYTAINGKGYVPALQLDSGEVLTEVQAIVQYLADLKPELKLAPANGSIERYRLQSWLSYISGELHKNVGPLFNPTATADAKDAALANIRRRLDYIEAQLGDAPWLLGSDFSVADVYLFNVMLWTCFVRIDIKPWPKVTDLFRRAGALPAVMSALKAEGLG